MHARDHCVYSRITTCSYFAHVHTHVVVGCGCVYVYQYKWNEMTTEFSSSVGIYLFFFSLSLQFFNFVCSVETMHNALNTNQCIDALNVMQHVFTFRSKILHTFKWFVICGYCVNVPVLNSLVRFLSSLVISLFRMNKRLPTRYPGSLISRKMYSMERYPSPESDILSLNLLAPDMHINACE